MKITNIKPLIGWIGHRNQLIVKVETDEGIFGWGESGLSGREKAVYGAIEHFSQFLIGADPTRIGALWQQMYRSQYFEGGRVLTAAISALDIAFHDIKAKAYNVPVYQLLGGKQRDRVPTFATVSAEPGPQMIEESKTLIEQGWNCIRFMGSGQKSQSLFEPRESIAKTAHWCDVARQELGSEVVLGIDYHHRLSVAEAASFCQKMPKATLDFIEEPIRDESPASYEALRRMTDIPFAIGEEFASKWQFQPYIEQNIHQFNRIDTCNVGGLTEAMKVAGWSEVHYVDMMPHNPLGPICTAASVHFSAAVPNFSWLEHRVYQNAPQHQSNEHEFFPQQIELKDTHLVIPTEAGLGITVDEERFAHETFKFWEAPHLWRQDGSYTNW